MTSCGNTASIIMILLAVGRGPVAVFVFSFNDFLNKKTRFFVRC